MKNRLFKVIILFIMILSVVPVSAAPSETLRSAGQDRSRFFGFFGSSITKPSAPKSSSSGGIVAGVTDTAPSAPIVQPTKSSDDIEAEMISLLNSERTNAGLPALTLNNEISEIAHRKTKDMIDHSYFEHDLSPHETSFEMLRNADINYSSAGENLAFAYPQASTVMQIWMNSEDHRFNILNSDYNQCGIAVLQNKRGTHYWTMIFVDAN